MLRCVVGMSQSLVRVCTGSTQNVYNIYKSSKRLTTSDHLIAVSFLSGVEQDIRVTTYYEC